MLMTTRLLRLTKYASADIADFAAGGLAGIVVFAVAVLDEVALVSVVDASVAAAALALTVAFGEVSAVAFVDSVSS